MLKKKLSVKAVFGLTQVVLSFSAVIIALILKFDIFQAQSLLNVSVEGVNFYFMLLLVLGSVSMLGGAFLIYDWWES